MHYLDAHDAHLGDAATPSPLPMSIRAALHDPVWFAAMEHAFNALTDNGIWSLQ